MRPATAPRPPPGARSASASPPSPPGPPPSRTATARRLLPLLLLLGSTACLAPPRVDPSRVRAETGAALVDLVARHFFDAQRGRQWAERHRDLGLHAPDEQAFARDVHAALAELSTSHTAWLPADDPRHAGLTAIFAALLEPGDVRAPSLGLVADERGFVTTVLAGSPAEAAGVLRGDRILAADGRPFHPVRSLAGRVGRPLQLAVERHAGAPPLLLEVAPRLVDPRQEWLSAQVAGTRVLDVDGVAVAYVPLYSCAGEGPEQALRDAVAGPLREADALVLDLRGGWGGCSPGLVTLWDGTPPVLQQFPRDGPPVVVDGQWRGATVLLVDGGTRSGKEVVADALQRAGKALVVGQPTAGAVVGGRPFPLPDGSLLYLAVSDARVDGRRLEGVGVQPDVVVPDRLEHAAGADDPRDEALRRAAAAVSGAGR